MEREFISTKEIFERIANTRYKNRKKDKKEFQELGAEICTKLKVDVKDQGLIFKICKTMPKSYVLHCLNETLELAKGDKSHYFVKLIYVKNDRFRNKTRGTTRRT